MNANVHENGGEYCVLERADFQCLFDILHRHDYEVIGPTVRDEAIVYDAIHTVEDLPIGWTDEQEGGTYRLHRRGDPALFGYTVGPHSWKQFLLPPLLRLWQATQTDGRIEIEQEVKVTPTYAFLGVRACDLWAIHIQDQIFMEGSYQDSDYAERRTRALIIAVNCGQAGNTCFCASMGTGPEATVGFDLALTEVLSEDRHYFVVEAGSDQGKDILSELPHRAATPAEIEARASVIVEAAVMGRSLDAEGLKELLYRNLEHPRWDAVADRCLTCGNCTLVCPTCFCTTIDDVTDLTGTRAERWRKTNTCFSVEFSYVHGGSIRASSKSRFRQWMTHKLATWVDQFGMYGCVGCGRCITWCPVGIDITEEARAIRAADRQ
jgi:sulfhydrogenase subunit beta (sulfur reductase)